MWPKSLNLDVSRETRDKLEIYHALLLKWQKAINLVSPKTIDEAWIRHFADSVQIEAFVSRESLRVADIGSGAGFPGLVLAILRPDIEVHLIESDERKCQFLKTVSRETSVDINVHNARIESCANQLRPDIVTARALADLHKLMGYMAPWVEMNPDLQCVFLKGAKINQEIESAAVDYAFLHEVFPSQTDSQGCILKLSNISQKSGV